MDLSDNESAFSYGEMNETIYVNSHIEEEFMVEDVGMYFSYNSDEKSDIIMIENVEELKDPMLWERFDKDVEDFTIEEVNLLSYVINFTNFIQKSKVLDCGRTVRAKVE